MRSIKIMFNFVFVPSVVCLTNLYCEDKSALQSISVIIVHCCWDVSCGVGVLCFDMLCDINGELRSANSAHTYTHVFITFITFHERRINLCILELYHDAVVHVERILRLVVAYFLDVSKFIQPLWTQNKNASMRAHNNPRESKKYARDERKKQFKFHNIHQRIIL